MEYHAGKQKPYNPSEPRIDRQVSPKLKLEVKQ